MKSSFFNFSIQDFDHIKSLQQLRERLLNRLLLSAFIIGTALLAVAMIPAFQRGMVGIIAIYTMIYLWLIVVTFMRRLPSDRWAGGWLTTRIASWLGFFFVLGLVNLYLSGFNADAGLFFLTFVAMSALLFDLRRGLLAFGVSLALILLFGYLTVSGRFELQMESPQPSNPLLWIIGGAVFLVTSIPLIIAFTALVRGLVVNLDRVTTEAEKLGDANLALQEIRDELEVKVREREESYRILLENSMQGIIVFQDDHVAYVNPAVTNMFGYTLDLMKSLTPEQINDMFHPADQPMMLRRLQDRREGRPVPERYELRAPHKNGEMRFMEASTIPILYGGRPALQTTVIDLTERKKVEQALRESEEKYKTLVENVNIGIFQSTLEGAFLHANSAVLNMAGYDCLDEFQNIPAQRLYADPSQRERVVQELRERGTVKNVEMRSLKKDNSVYWISLNAVLLRDKDGTPISILGSVADVTERKRMEQSLAQARDELEQRVVERTWKLLETQEQLRNLTKEVILAQEEERRHVSRELHDEAGQALVSMKYGLESILAELPADSPPVQRRLAQALQQLDQTMEKIRHLAHSLRPPLFDIADLDLTIEDHCREFAESTDLQIEYSGVPVPDLSEEAGLSFFRFLQEALTNIVKHAKATRVEVKLRQNSGRLSLSVADNGVGAPDNRSDGRGHIGMRERFMMLNGEIQIQSNVQSGFVITASIPYSAKHNQAVTRS